ncbi:MAG TPA: hypothetical protein VFS21_29275 [Roseiflexaceae bacterium]|nr:hypothetical protein [Roseiflexaceae bacterium]
MTERKGENADSTPRPSQAEGEREAVEEKTGDRNNQQQTRHDQKRDTQDTTPRPSQAEGERK